MLSISKIVAQIDAFVWGQVMLVLLVGTGVLLTVRCNFLTWRNLPWALKKTLSKEARTKSRGTGDVSPFSALTTALAATIGTGNIVGVATAMVSGGAGALVWMWISACFGLSSKFSECMLAIKYREVNEKGEMSGGPMYTMKKGLKNKKLGAVLGWLFALFAVIASFGIGNMTQGNSIATSVHATFGVSVTMVGVVITVLALLIIIGGIKTISKVSSVVVPVMAIFYVVAGIIVILGNIHNLPAGIAMIFKMAFSVKAVGGALCGNIVASMMNAARYGVARGCFSNEAGMGCGAIVSAAAECSHPVKQGLIQSFSIYVDTLFIGTSTALIVLLTGTFDVTDGAGNLLMSQTGGIEAGIKWTQHALMSTFGSWSGKALAIIIVLFVFTSMTGYCYQAESNIRYLTGNSKKAIAIARAIFLAASFMGAIVNADAVWAMGDIGYGLMAWANIIAIALLAPKAVALLKDYEKQKKEGKEPAFDPKEFGIEDETGAWK